MKKTSLSKGAIFITISTLVFVLSGYIINIWLGRFLGPSSYGIYGLIITLMTAINLTQTSGLPLAVAKYIAENEKNADSVLKSGLILQVISTLFASIVFYLLAVPIAQLLNDITLVPYIKATAAIFPFYGIYSIYMNYYNGLHQFNIQAYMQIVYSLVKVVAVIALVYLFNVYGAILGFIISPIVALLFWLHLPSAKSLSFSYKKIILFSLPLIGFAIFSNLLQSVDILFVKGLLHSNSLTGIYTADQNIAKMPFYGVAALASVLFPGISRSISQKNSEETIKLITNAIRFSILIILPSTLLISATSLEIIDLFYSSAYTNGAIPLSILAIGNLFFTLFIILTSILSGAGSPGKTMVLAGIGCLINSLLCILLIPQFGLIGAAISTSIASAIVMVISALIVYEKFKVFITIKSALKIFLASIIIYFLAQIIPVPTILLPIYYLVLFALYIGMLFLLKEIRDADIRLVKNLIPAWVKK